ncbi:hypothetical protein AC628_33955 [Bradyrhizobium sp. NAS96.2]|nr:hypothetical protein AC628_33955 [Bradyrhizobium sp. NAS96.2]
MLALQCADEVRRKEAFAVLPPSADEISKIHCPFVCCASVTCLRRVMGLLRRPGCLMCLPGAGMMDKTNVPAPSRSESGRVALTVDRKLAWPELVRQQIDIAEYVNQDV